MHIHLGLKLLHHVINDERSAISVCEELGQISMYSEAYIATSSLSRNKPMFADKSRNATTL